MDFAARNSCSRCSAARLPATSRASRSSENAANRSPAAGVPLQPSTSTGVDGPATLLDAGLQHHATRTPVGIGLEFEEFGREQDHVEQLLHVRALLRRNL